MFSDFLPVHIRYLFLSLLSIAGHCVRPRALRCRVPGRLGGHLAQLHGAGWGVCHAAVARRAGRGGGCGCGRHVLRGTAQERQRGRVVSVCGKVNEGECVRDREAAETWVCVCVVCVPHACLMQDTGTVGTTEGCEQSSMDNKKMQGLWQRDSCFVLVSPVTASAHLQGF
jgi:hypothetical protein